MASLNSSLLKLKPGNDAGARRKAAAPVLYMIEFEFYLRSMSLPGVSEMWIERQPDRAYVEGGVGPSLGRHQS